MLVPVEAHILALEGLADLLGTIELVRESLNPGLRVGGVLACRVSRTRHTREVVELLHQQFPGTMLGTAVRESARLAEAPAFKQPILSYAPDSTGAEDYRAIAAAGAGGPARGGARVSRPKTTLPYNPVAQRMRAMIGTVPVEPTQPAEQGQPSEWGQPMQSAKPAYCRASFQIPQQLLAEIRDAVIALSGPPERLTMARFAEQAFRHELERLQTDHNEGRPFPSTDGVVRVGRPVGS